jgi:cell division septation protein DedD
MGGMAFKDLDRIVERGSVRLSSAQARSLTLGVVALLLLAFVLGLQVGKVFTPSEGEVVAPDVATADRTIAEILESYQQVSEASPRVDGLAAAESVDAPEPPEPVTAVPEESPTVEPPEPATPAPPAILPPIPQVPRVEIPVVEPPPEPPPEPVEVQDDALAAESPVELPADPMAALPSPGGAGSYEVQLASWPTAAEAEEMVDLLETAGIRAYRVAADVRGQTWHRVRVGRFASRAKAAEWIGPLTAYTPYDPIVVND